MNIEPDEKVLSQVMIRRLKTDIVDKDGNPRYPKEAFILSRYTTRMKKGRSKSPYSIIARAGRGPAENRWSCCSIHQRFIERGFCPPCVFSTLEKHYELSREGEKKLRVRHHGQDLKKGDTQGR